MAGRHARWSVGGKPSCLRSPNAYARRELTTLSADFVVLQNGHPVAARRYGGTGPDVVLLHGRGSNLASWNVVAGQLAAACRVVAVDLRGHGRTPSGYPTFGETAEDVLAVVRRACITPPVVVGHSLGAWIALLYAARGHPCAGVITVDQAILETPADIAIRRPRTDLREHEKRMREIAPDVEGTRAYVDEQIRTLTVPGLDADDERLVARQEVARRRFRPIGEDLWRRYPDVRHLVKEVEVLERLSDEEHAEQWPSTRALEKIRVPMLAIFASGYRFAQLADQIAETYRPYPRITIDWIDSGHLVPLERPTELASLVAAFATPP